MKTVSSAISLGRIIGYRVVDPSLEEIGRVHDVHFDRQRRAGEILVAYTDSGGETKKIGWRDAVICPERCTLMVIPTLLK